MQSEPRKQAVLDADNIDTCINALRRFICRRGQAEIRSDNGTNFVGSSRELKEALKELNQEKIQKALLQEGIKWTLNPPPPHGAHHGGIWERLILQVKRTLLCAEAADFG